VQASTKVEDSGVPGASSGISTAQAETKVPTASSGASTASSASSARPTDDVLDLGEASREAVLKRALPVLGGLTIAVLAALTLRIRPRGFSHG